MGIVETSIKEDSSIMVGDLNTMEVKIILRKGKENLIKEND